MSMMTQVIMPALLLLSQQPIPESDDGILAGGADPTIGRHGPPEPGLGLGHLPASAQPACDFQQRGDVCFVQFLDQLAQRQLPPTHRLIEDARQRRVRLVVAEPVGDLVRDPRQAAVELHGTVGPVNSTVTDVAKLAGVSRMTVYNHFPTEVDLFTACSSHWASRNPFPDPSRWTEVTDPWERLGSALEEMYGWYDRKQQMLGNVLRDVSVVPALAEVMDELWATYMTNVVGALAEGMTPRPGEDQALHATLRLAVDFDTWRTLTESGLGHGKAAAVMARMVRGATDTAPAVAPTTPASEGS